MILEVFEPPMCCSTGVCGPSVDRRLVAFASDLEWVKTKGIKVKRYNLSANPLAFASNEVVRRAMSKANGSDGIGKLLPLLLVDGEMVFSGKYPERSELSAALKLEVPSVRGAAKGRRS